MIDETNAPENGAGEHSSAPSVSTQPDWLNLANTAYQQSTNHLDANFRHQWERNLRQFHSLHPLGSRYESEEWKRKSRIFRPKTRATLRAKEAAAAVAFFSTMDVLAVTAHDDSDPVQLASADFWQAALNHRLTKDVPWFLTVMGALQESNVMGLVVSYQSWDFEMDAPAVDVRPIENIRFHPAANWLDPINSSPYLIDLIPMHTQDLRERIDGDTDDVPWIRVTDEQIKQATVKEVDSTRMVREKHRTDPMANDHALSDWEVAWVRRVFMRHKGKDLIYYTLGDQVMLSEPIAVSEAYLHCRGPGKRPYVRGITNVESQRAHPSAPTELWSSTQAELNDNANARMDNVKLVLNKRYLVRRHRNVDLRSLNRNIPGSTTMVDDIADVDKLEWNDVTSSAYAEQDRLNLDFDDLAGAFSGSSVQSNRQLNETVGGLQLLNSSANQVSEYDLTTFKETWVEPVVAQLLAIEQAYETDETILLLAGRKAGLVQKYGINEITDEILDSRLTTMVNVGMGATNPLTYMERFVSAIGALERTFGAEAVASNLDFEAVASEIFGKVGHKYGKRFFKNSEDPRVAALMDQINQLQQRLAQKKSPALEEAETTLKNAQAIKTMVESFFGATQAGQNIALQPDIAPVADSVLDSAGYHRVAPDAGQQGALSQPEHPLNDELVEEAQPDRNTSPLEPAIPQSSFDGFGEGIEGGAT